MARSTVLPGLLMLLCAAGAAGAQEAAPGAPKATRLVLLGTAAGPIPRTLRAQPASLLVVGERPYLIDAGNGVARQLALAGYAPSDVRNVFITHHHMDHNADVGALMGFAWIEDIKRNVPGLAPVRFYGPPGTSELVQAGYRYLSVAERIFRAGMPLAPAAGKFEGIDVAGQGEIFRDDRVRVTVAENSHYSGAAPGPDKSYSYRFDTPGRSVVFCGDSGPSEALQQLARGADDLVCEVNDMDGSLKEMSSQLKLSPQALQVMRLHMARNHLTPEQLGRLAKAAGVKRVVLTHLAPGGDGETDFAPYVDGVRREFGGSVVVGRDLLEL